MSPDEDELVNLSTSTVAPPDVQRDFMTAHEVREAAYEEFKARLDEDTQEKFYDKLRKQSLRTFTNVSAKRQLKTAKDVLKAESNLFSHMIFVAKSRQAQHERSTCSPYEATAMGVGKLSWNIEENK